MLGKVLKLSRRYLLSFFSYRENTGGGGVIFTPQWGRVTTQKVKTQLFLWCKTQLFLRPETSYAYSSLSALLHKWLRFKAHFLIFLNKKIFSQYQYCTCQLNPKIEIAVWYSNSLQLLLEINTVLSVKVLSWRRFPRSLIFDRNRQNMKPIWRHLRPTYQDMKTFP